MGCWENAELGQARRHGWWQWFSKRYFVVVGAVDSRVLTYWELWKQKHLIFVWIGISYGTPEIISTMVVYVWCMPFFIHVGHRSVMSFWDPKIRNDDCSLHFIWGTRQCSLVGTQEWNDMVASLSNPFDVAQCCLVGIRTWNCNSLNLIHIVYNWFLSLCPFGVRFNNAANRFQKRIHWLIYTLRNHIWFIYDFLYLMSSGNMSEP